MSSFISENKLFIFNTLLVAGFVVFAVYMQGVSVDSVSSKAQGAEREENAAPAAAAGDTSAQAAASSSPVRAEISTPPPAPLTPPNIRRTHDDDYEDD